MPRPRIIARSFSLSLCLALCSSFVSSGAAWSQAPELSLEIETVTLDNGLRVVLAPDDASPTVAVAVYYDVGSRDEVPGRSGFAHLFEHMMFQGSANIPKGGHFQHINRNGGRMNGTTSPDRTNYFQVLPADRLPLALWLESDRMLSLDISLENFENQREVVKEERRLRVDNEPYVPAILAFDELAYQSFEYAHSVIGSMDDLDAAELSDVQAFFDLYYAPNNAVLVIAGDFEREVALRLVERYFGRIPRGADPPPVAFEEPPQTEVRLQDWDDPLATQPALMLGWQAPPMAHEDHVPLQLLALVLSGGQSSRLYQRVVRADQLAIEVSAYVRGRRGPDMFAVWSVTRGADPGLVRFAVLEEVARVAEHGVTDEELDAAKEQMTRQVIASVETTLGRSLVLGRDELYFRESDRINGLLPQVRAVTAAQVQQVAQRYLHPDRYSAMQIRPAAQTEVAR